MNKYTQEEMKIIKRTAKMTGVSINYIAKCVDDFKECGYYSFRVGDLCRYLSFKVNDTKKFKNEDGRKVPWTKEDYIDASIL